MNNYSKVEVIYKFLTKANKRSVRVSDLTKIKNLEVNFYEPYETSTGEEIYLHHGTISLDDAPWWSKKLRTRDIGFLCTPDYKHVNSIIYSMHQEFIEKLLRDQLRAT